MTFKTILISGIPGTGKTTITKELSKKYHYQFLSIGDIVIKNQLYSEEDKSRETKIVDENKLQKYMKPLFDKQKRNLILESHYIDIISHPSIEIAIILRCNPDILYQRLKKRNYSENKIKENIQAEILGDSTSYMFEKEILKKNNRIFEVDTSQREIKECVEIIHQIIQNPEKKIHFLAGKISWSSETFIEKYL